MVEVQSRNGEFLNRMGEQDSPSSPESIRHNFYKEQAFARRLNILIFGLTDLNSPEEDFKEVDLFFKNQMGLPTLTIHETYRLGNYSQSAQHPRPLVVKFTKIQDRWAVWNNRRKIPYDKQSPIRIQEDLPRPLRENARILQRIARVANQNRQEYGEARVKDYRVMIGGEWYGIENISRLPPELQPQSVYSPRSPDSVVFITKHSPLSNHHHSPFSINGMNFSCVEQYLALAKASMAKNESLAKKAMDLKEPSEHKGILNQLRNEVKEEWEIKAPDIILPAIRAKFQQNEQLANFLIETFPLAIGEASRNTMWGIGMQLEHKDVLDSRKWEKYENLLGNTLVQVRAELMTNLNQPSVPS